MIRIILGSILRSHPGISINDYFINITIIFRIMIGKIIISSPLHQWFNIFITSSFSSFSSFFSSSSSSFSSSLYRKAKQELKEAPGVWYQATNPTAEAQCCLVNGQSTIMIFMMMIFTVEVVIIIFSNFKVGNVNLTYIQDCNKLTLYLLIIINFKIICWT